MGASRKKIFLMVISLIFVLVIFLFVADLALAVEADDLGLSYAEATGLPTQDIRVIIAKIIRVALGLLGIIAVVIVIYGGFVWMTSGGDQAKIDQAKKIMINGAIGLIIILLAFAIVSFIINALIKATSEGFGERAGDSGYGRGALGGGIIESHYPPRGAHCYYLPPKTDGCIPRNTSIIVTFKEKMEIASFIKDYDDNGTPLDTSDDITPAVLELNVDNIKIFANEDNKDKEEIENFLPADKFRVSFTEDLQTFVFRLAPNELFGSASRRMYYSVRLGKNIKKANGDDAFPPGPQGFYIWDFEVGTFIDLDPPEVDDVFPVAGSTEYINAVIQINFNEAIDPTTASGQAQADGSGFNKIIVYQVLSDGTENQLGGKFTIANQYQTVEFTTDNSCGLNSCGDEVFCLPELSDIKVKIKAATLSDSPPQAEFGASGFDGVTDVASNSLNGNGQEGNDCQDINCSGEDALGENHCSCAIGPEEDNYFWLFKTNNEALKSAPELIEIYPAEISEVDPIRPVEGLFNRILMGRTVTTSNIPLASTEDPYCSFSTSFKNQDSDNDGYNDQSRVYIRHDSYKETPLDQPDFNFYYSAGFNSGIKDVYQNCYLPTSGPNCSGDPSCCNFQGHDQPCPPPLPLDWSP